MDLNHPPVSEMGNACPRCDMIFTMLETVSSGERVQDINMQERGQNACLVVTSPSHYPRALHTKPHSVLVHRFRQHASSSYTRRLAIYLVPWILRASIDRLQNTRCKYRTLVIHVSVQQGVRTWTEYFYLLNMEMSTLPHRAKYSSLMFAVIPGEFSSVHSNPLGRFRLFLNTGEPKSGTTFMYHWTHGALVHTCNFLNHWFGSDSCHAEAGRLRGMFHTPTEIRLTFDPRRGGEDAKCSCPDVDRCELAARR